jgi:O-antigen ligase
LLFTGEVNRMFPTDLNNRSEPQTSWSDLSVPASATEASSLQTAEPLPTDQSTRKPKPPSRLEKRRKLILFFALALVFTRISMIHQILEYFLHTNTYLLYFVAIPVIIGIPVVGAFKRAFRYRTTWFWTAFALWLIPTSAFSTWRGGSFAFIGGYYRTELILLFATAGLIITWQECQWLLYTLSAAALVNVVSFLLLRKLDENGRTVLPFGTVGNSNDYAAHLMFVLPFLLWPVLVSKSKLVRIVGIFALALALYEILAAGSRGALLGIAAALLIFALTTTPRIRLTLFVTVPILGILMIGLLPTTVTHRILSFSTTGPDASSEAAESAESRERVLHDAIQFTLQHPLLGLGPGQFGNNEGEQTTKAGNKLWIEAHNSFAQVASENGFPGFIFYLGGILSSWFLLECTSRRLTRKRGVKEAAAAILCLRIGLVSFCATIFFVNFGYFFYLPALAGIIIAVTAGSKQRLVDLSANETPQIASQPAEPIESTDWDTSAPAGT